MIPTPKYSIGQAVVCVRVSWSERKVTCPDCLGTKLWRIILPSKEEFDHDCRTCSSGWFSTGLVSEWGDFIRKFPLTVGSIQMDTNDKDGPFRYMCVETGIGSGNVYYERELFADDESADAYGAAELERVKGLRQEEELRLRALKKKDSLIHGKRKKK